jgi:hypothetical protein
LIKLRIVIDANNCKIEEKGNIFRCIIANGPAVSPFRGDPKSYGQVMVRCQVSLSNATYQLRGYAVFMPTHIEISVSDGRVVGEQPPPKFARL